MSSRLRLFLLSFIAGCLIWNLRQLGYEAVIGVRNKFDLLRYMQPII